MTSPRSSDPTPAATRTFEEHRGMLAAIAYRVLGTMADAEDVVQDAWLRWSRVPPDEVRNPRGFLVRVAARLAIDRLRRRQARHEEYHGEWLPEPVLAGPGPEEHAELAESVSTALLLVLETLSPLERAVFVLREAFGFSHAEVAETVGRSEEAVRQLAHRARRHVDERRPRYRADAATSRAVTERFLAASASGDLHELMAVMAPEVRLVADSGGKVRAPLLPITGADKVARFFLATVARVGADAEARIVALNGTDGVVVSLGGTTVAAVTFEIDGGRLRSIYLVGNPDKLRSLGG